MFANLVRYLPAQTIASLQQHVLTAEENLQPLAMAYGT